MNKKKVIIPLLSAALLFPSAVNVFAEPHKPIESVKSVEFIGMPAPVTNEEKSTMYSDAKVKVTLKDGTKKTVELDYTSLAEPGDVINGKIVGAASTSTAIS